MDAQISAVATLHVGARRPIAAAVAFAATLACAAADEVDYRIWPGDVLAVSVLSRPELSRDYRVRLDGAISLHIIGSVQAAGRTVVDVERSLEARFGEAFESVASVTVEVADFRPVIVAGAVARPGAHPFLAGLTVDGAVALAGGLRRVAQDADVTAQMRVEDQAARHAILRTRLAVALVERARLAAERDGTDRLELGGRADRALGAATRDLIDAQSAVRAARDAQSAAFIADAEASIDLAATEADAYRERRALIGRQLDATVAELEAQLALSERGLARTQRVLDLRVAADRFRADDLETVALEAEARRVMAKARADINDLEARRQRDVAERLAAVDAQITEARAELEQARRFVEIFGGGPLVAALDGAQIAYAIRRRSRDGYATIDAEADSIVAPGDFIEVTFGAPDPLGVGIDIEDGRSR